ncbi:MAG: helix-turn-helix transcriptional regulator [Pseudomonadota bacterium]
MNLPFDTSSDAGPDKGASRPDAALFLARVGARVRSRRKERKLSRRVLSERSGVSQRYLAQLEAGEGNISLALLLRVAAALGLPVESLVASEPLSKVIDGYLGADPGVRRDVAALLGATPPERGSYARRVALIGLRGAGKSTLGRAAAETLGIPFRELRTEIEETAGMPASEIFALYGPEGYRQLEARALAQVAERLDQVVLAVAGGIVEDAASFDLLRSQYRTIWIKAAPHEHMSRVQAQGDHRPMQGNPQAMDVLDTILRKRETSYARAACQLDTTGQPVDASARALADLIGSFLTGDP